ncbi:DUF262 domain-containing HNH endonuclease family protein [Sporolactobacillus sp. STCC-11]|uniref:DUF262 domain-containing protein n=1 Tax=Sporolactobacillus caesalpiniae TaxID=3230362 RepID=UPI003395A540
MAKLENYKYSIDEAFRACFYVVPDYQREYVWTDREVQQLLDDIDDEMTSGSGKEYFIGTILVSPTDVKNHYEVIDGQQRLTTFFIILCALRHLFQGAPQYQTISELISTSYTNIEGDTISTLKLDPRYENASELMGKLVEINSDPVTTKNEVYAAGIQSFGSLENLLNAYDIVYRYLNDNYKEKGLLKKYWGYLSNNVIFIQISTDISSALKIFETINERGIGLNPMDLLKNLLFAQVQKGDFNKLKDMWKKVTGPLEKNGEKPLRFLRYFLMANYKIKNNRNDYVVREDEIYDWFANKSNAALCNYQKRPFEFVNHLILNVSRYIDYIKGRGNDGQYNLQMNHLRKLCGGAFSLHYVLLLAGSNLPKSLFDHFVEQLESFLFYYIFTKTSTKELERNFSLWADELREICSITDPSEQTKQYNQFLNDHFTKNVAAKSVELADDLKRYTLYSMQRYRTRYLLAKLTQFVDMAYKGLKTPGALDDYVSLEIEHILPNTPTTQLKDEFVMNNPDKNYDEYKNMLGNLTLLEKPINIVASNDFFNKKCAEYKKSKHYLTSSITGLVVVGNNSSINRINLFLKAFNAWNANTIEERQALLIQLSKEVWKIKEI